MAYSKVYLSAVKKVKGFGFKKWSIWLALALFQPTGSILMSLKAKPEPILSICLNSRFINLHKFNIV